ncbi:hypothetical protein ACFRR7_32960 [Streptomyces sp. NPDC056909]|uniref:hypothetical protein n=1 Tax=Streptomyces sp. NPDC056909 TaxID=3345963 RepID=UPI0036C31726
MSESGMRKRLANIGVPPGDGRDAALFALATKVLRAILSRKLGLSIDVAVYWRAPVDRRLSFSRRPRGHGAVAYARPPRRTALAAPWRGRPE